MSSNIRSLSNVEIACVSAAGPGGTAAHAAFVGAAAAVGGAIGARFGELSGSEFGALLGSALCSPGGPEASAACAAIGGIAGIRLGDVAGRDAGAGAAGVIAESIWSSLFGDDNAAGPTGASYNPEDGGFVDMSDQGALADVSTDFADNFTFDQNAGGFDNSEFGSGSDWGLGTNDNGDWGGYTDLGGGGGSDWAAGLSNFNEGGGYYMDNQIAA